DGACLSAKKGRNDEEQVEQEEEIVFKNNTKDPVKENENGEAEKFDPVNLRIQIIFVTLTLILHRKTFDAEKCKLNLNSNRKIKATPKMIHDILGILMADIKVVALDETASKAPTRGKWRATLPYK
ncbi:hypothetical protein Tco_0828075, partial [Tanacetum coccineum]